MSAAALCATSTIPANGFPTSAVGGVPNSENPLEALWVLPADDLQTSLWDVLSPADQKAFMGSCRSARRLAHERLLTRLHLKVNDIRSAYDLAEQKPLAYDFHYQPQRQGKRGKGKQQKKVRPTAEDARKAGVAATLSCLDRVRQELQRYRCLREVTLEGLWFCPETIAALRATLAAPVASSVPDTAEAAATMSVGVTADAAGGNLRLLAISQPVCTLSGDAPKNVAFSDQEVQRFPCAAALLVALDAICAERRSLELGFVQLDHWGAEHNVSAPVLRAALQALPLFAARLVHLEYQNEAWLMRNHDDVTPAAIAALPNLKVLVMDTDYSFEKEELAALLQGPQASAAAASGAQGAQGAGGRFGIGTGRDLSPELARSLAAAAARARAIAEAKATAAAAAVATAVAMRRIRQATEAGGVAARPPVATTPPLPSSVAPAQAPARVVVAALPLLRELKLTSRDHCWPEAFAELARGLAAGAAPCLEKLVVMITGESRTSGPVEMLGQLAVHDAWSAMHRMRRLEVSEFRWGDDDVPMRSETLEQGLAAVPEQVELENLLLRPGLNARDARSLAATLPRLRCRVRFLSVFWGGALDQIVCGNSFWAHDDWRERRLEDPEDRGFFGDDYSDDDDDDDNNGNGGWRSGHGGYGGCDSAGYDDEDDGEDCSDEEMEDVDGEERGRRGAGAAAASSRGRGSSAGGGDRNGSSIKTAQPASAAAAGTAAAAAAADAKATPADAGAAVAGTTTAAALALLDDRYSASYIGMVAKALIAASHLRIDDLQLCSGVRDDYGGPFFEAVEAALKAAPQFKRTRVYVD